MPNNNHDPASPVSSHFGGSTIRTTGSPPKLEKSLSLDTQYKGPVIPPSTKDRRKHRTLVLCFDGTGDQFDADNSNVVNFFSLLKKGDSKQQLVYYQAGIGTYTIPQIATPLMSKLRKSIDMCLGSSLHHHVMGGYEFLMQNFKEGDRICIFGFSRGAYTARALAGMIEKVGLLPAGNHQQVPFAYKMYMRDDEEGWNQSVLFKKSFSMDVDIEFLGVWDTVDSVGIIPRHVPFTKHNTALKTFRHAISLDEHRVKFKANLWDKVITNDIGGGDISFTPFKQRRANWRKWRLDRAKRKLETKLNRELEEAEVKEIDNKYNRSSRLQAQFTDKSKETDVLEVWFAGCHTDVGGGSVPNETRYSAARIPLRWMIRECFRVKCGIQFEAGRLHEVGLDPHALYPVVRDRPPPLPVSSVVLDPEEAEADNAVKEAKRAEKPTYKAKDGVLCRICPEHASNDDGSCHNGHAQEESDVTRVERNSTDKSPIDPNEREHSNGDDYGPEVNEEHEELHDALSPHYDQLVQKRAWWILEFLPLVHLHTKEDGSTVKVISLNCGRPRKVNHQEAKAMKVHRSVKMRMEAEAKALGKKYHPKVRFECEPTWID